MSFSSSSSRDTSPDPIVLPSSPLGNNRSARKSTPRRASRKFTRGSPSKSLILDTPNGAGGESPWRIRVTVEAEPREATSPGRKRRATTATKKTATTTSSIVMKTVPLKVESPGSEGGEEGNTRKRKGTPIRRGRSTRHQPPAAVVEPVETVEDNDEDIILQDMAPPSRPSASRRSSGRIGRLNSQSAPTLRSQRLSLAREELDIALQDAVGYGEEHSTRLWGEVDFSKSTRMLGDATLSRNEDFSMISVETLQTAKDSSLVAGLGNSTGSVEYMASSPPKRDGLRRSVLGNPVQFGRSSTLGKQAEFGRSSLLGKSGESTGRRSALGSPMEFGSSPKRVGADVMSWRPTGPAVVVRHESPSSQLKPVPHLRRSTGSQPHQASQSYGLDGANDEEDISQGIDLDIWQDEASRSLEEQPDGKEEVEREVEVEDDDEDELQAEDQLQSDAAAAQAATRSPAVEDLFADQPLKPARGKIPKTWRRSSGMDFSYVDSPAHGLVNEDDQPVEDERRHSADGSGVLTPPSTSEDENEDENEDEEDGEEDAGVADEDRREADEADDDMEYEEDGPGEEQQDYDQEEAQSEWNQPDAEATRFEGQNDERNDNAMNDNVSPLSDGNTDDEDTGSFFQSNMPAVFGRQNRPRRPPRRPRREEGSVDLTDLLGLKSSPIKPLEPAANPPSSSGTRPARQTQLLGGPYDGKMKLNPPQQERSAHRPKLVDSPLRKSLLKSSKMHGGSPDQKRQLHNHHVQAPAPAMKSFIVPAQRQQVQHNRHTYHSHPETKDSSSAVLSPAVLDRSQTRFPNSQSKVEVELDSFASKDSDQRQLLTEMTPRIGTGVGDGHTGQNYEDESEGPSSPAPIMRSYEENLNVDSPQKIPVHFGDSSSVLPPTKLFLSQAGRKSVSGNQYRPERRPEQQRIQAPKRPLAPKPIAVIDKRVPDVGKKVGGILSRLSETFWSAVIRPTGPTEIMPDPEQQQKYYHPQQHDVRDSKAFTSSLEISQEGDGEEEEEEEEFSDEGMGMFNTSLRTAIRNRYGVLPSTFPWTMAHMRTLHRMLNSLLSTRPDSLIPNAGPLPSFLEEITDTQQESVIEKSFLFTREHAYVVFSFLQILVGEDVVRGMETGEVQMLGDETSRRYRGILEGDSRQGYERVFVRKRGVGKWREEGEIGWEFVVGAVGCVVRCEEVAAATVTATAAEGEERGREGRRDDGNNEMIFMMVGMVRMVGMIGFLGFLGSGSFSWML